MYVWKHLNTCLRYEREPPQFFHRIKLLMIKTFEGTLIQQTLGKQRINPNFIIVMVKRFVPNMLEVRNISYQSTP